MTPFAPFQIEALRQLGRLWPPERCVLIGASALGCFMEMRWRQTFDLDLSLAASFDECANLLRSLPGWSLDPQVEHRWLATGGSQIDVIPAGPDLLNQGELTWPRSGQRMSLLGFRLAFEECVPVQVDADLSIMVAPVPVVALLKIVAYLDRPHERHRDLQDLAFVLENFVAPDAPERYSHAVFEADLTYEEVSPFLLGQRIAALANSTERLTTERFVSAIKNEDDSLGTQANFLAAGPASWRHHSGEFMRSVCAFARGLTR
jgi:predicted nucleotidyltransferase